MGLGLVAHGPRLPTGSVDGSSNDPGRPLGFRIADRTRGGAGRSGGRPLGFADSNRRRAVAIPRRIRASGNGDSGYASAEGAWKGGEEELAGVRLGRRAAARSRSGGRRLRVGWLSRSPGALPRWSGAGAEERRGSSRRSAASRQAGNSKSHATLYQKDIRCSVFAPEPYDPPTIGCPGKVLLLGADHRNREIHVRLVLATNERASKMASIVASSKVVALGALILFLLVFYGSCTSIVNFNASHITADPYWVPARATWYGLPTGAGPYDNGGACGFKNVNLPPFSAMTSCGNQPLFKDGKGCGSCYQIRCLNHPACSGNPETVSITDMNYYPVAKYHFDLSGTAFGALAKPGRNDELRHAGIIDIQFKRVPCIYPGQTVTFHIEHGSNPNYLAVLVEFEDGDGDVVQVDLMEANSGWWMPMRESWGSIWRMDRRRPLTGPFSLRITNESGQKLVAYQVIPANWAPNAYYRSNIQYDAFSNGAGAGAGAGLDIGSATGLVISSAAQLDTKILGVIVLICLVLCRLHRLMCCRS